MLWQSEGHDASMRCRWMSGATQVGLSMEEVGGRPGRAAGQLGNQSAGSSGARRLGPHRARGVRQRRLSSGPPESGHWGQPGTEFGRQLGQLRKG